MKIGILTFQHARNFGALLQCYALQELLKRKGYTVRVIDYRQKNIDKYNQFNYKLIINYLLKLRPFAAYYTYKAQWKKIKITSRYKRFSHKFLLLTKPCSKNNIPSFDKYIIGSDQVWSLACTDNELDDTYFGNFKRPHNSTIIGYAISSNITSLNKLGINRIREYINNFSFLSFREKIIAEKIEDFTNTKYPIVLDPTLLCSSDVYNCLINNKWDNKQYIVTYNLRSKKDEINNEAKKIAAKKGYNIIDLSFLENDVTDFVSIIKAAKIVITSSFHGVVFAIIFHKPLYAIKLNDGHDDRYINILKELTMEECLHDVNFGDCPIPITDWDKVETKLNKMRMESIDFLIKSIQDKVDI